jgi:hypothetical protein
VIKPLTAQGALEFAAFAKRVADGSKRASEFFLYWPDLARSESKAVVDLWFNVQYLEIDSESRKPNPVTLELHRERISELAGELEQMVAEGLFDR